MNILTRLLLVSCLALFTMGNRGCVTTDTIVLPEGPVATALGKEKDEQIKGLKEQVKAEQDARLMEQALASKAASGLKGIQKAREYLDDSPAKEAIGLESDLALTRLPPDDPAETVKSLERVVLIVTGQRDAALKKYQEANAQTAAERAAKEAKEREVAALHDDIAKREARIETLSVEAKAEKLAHAKDVQSTIDRLTKERDEAEQKSIMFWLGIGAVVLIIGGVVLIAATSGRLVIQGSILSVGGGLVILLRLGYLSLISQPWFPVAAGIVVAIIVGTIGWAIYRMWVAHKLDDKKTQAIQDMRDEAAAKGDTKAIDTLDEHLEYRMGQDGSFWQKQQVKTEVALGLVDPKGEVAIKKNDGSS